MKTSSSRTAAANAFLKASTTLWLAVALLGQWAFVYYIAGFYGPSTLRGDFQAWSRNDNLIKGYVAGDSVGNLAFAAHVMLAAVVTFSGALQLIPQVRARAPAFHRWNGRVFLLAVIAASLGGLYMVWVRGTALNLAGALASTLNAVLILGFAALAWRTARAREFAAHRRWALRLYLVSNGVWFLRVGLLAWVIVNRGPVGTTERLDGPFDLFWIFGSYLLPLAVLELYLRARDKAGAGGRLAMAGGLVVVAGLMSIGIVGAFMMMWWPLLSKA